MKAIAKQQVKERPILFSSPMVRAILAGRKTQTRRVIKPQPKLEWVKCDDPGHVWLFDPGEKYRFKLCVGDPKVWDYCPYGKIGERLWVRETWAEVYRLNGKEFSVIPPTGKQQQDAMRMVIYRADGYPDNLAASWRPSIFLPRKHSRITLEITSVRVERLKEISEADAIAEGLEAWSDPPRVTTTHYGLKVADVWETDPRKAYARLWDTINGKKFPASCNPWVWVVEFKRVES